MFTNVDWFILIGQLLGFVAVILGFVTFQMKSARALLVTDMLTFGVFCAHYLLIGAISGCTLNLVGMLRNVVYTNRDKKIFAGKAWPFIMAGVMLLAGLLSWQDWRSVFMIAALVINTLCMSLPNAQHIRYSLLFTCPFALTYNVILHSYGGVLYELMALTSAVIGIIRFRKEKV